MSMWNAANLVRRRRACVGPLAGFAFVMLSASFAEAEYGPRTTLGNNYQQTSNTRSTNGIDPGNCSSNISCYVLLQVAPQQKALIVQHVSCVVFVSTGEIYQTILTTRKGQTFLQRRTDLIALPTGGLGGSYWVVNSPVKHLLKPGERAAVFFLKSGGNINWGTPPCTIAGKLQ